MQYAYTSQHKLIVQSTVSSSSMGSNSVSENKHLKISAAPSLATIVFAENAAQIGEPEDGVIGSCLKSKWLRTLEITILTGVILFVCSLFTIPTILFIVPHLPMQDINTGVLSNTSRQDGLNVKNASDLSCVNCSTPSDHSELRCAERFFLDNSSSSGNPICVPLCKSWLTVEPEDVAFSVCIIASIILSIILVIVARQQRGGTFTYPTYYLIYICAAIVLAAPIFIIGSLLKVEVFCGSDSYIESLTNSTPFCVVTGIVGVYLLLQVVLFLTFHAVGLSWGIIFPFHYRRFKIHGRIKYIHASTVILGFILPAFPALLQLIDGYTIGIDLHTGCVGRSEALSYSFVTLPISILSAVTTSVFVILLWKIFKELILKKLLLKQKPMASIRKAEMKIFVIMCYYTLLGVILLSALAFIHATVQENSIVIRNYFLCQSAGIQPDKDCGDTPEVLNHRQMSHVLALMGRLLQCLLPIVILTFVIDWKCSRSCTCLKNERLN